MESRVGQEAAPESKVFPLDGLDPVQAVKQTGITTSASGPQGGRRLSWVIVWGRGQEVKTDALVHAPLIKAGTPPPTPSRRCPEASPSRGRLVRSHRCSAVLLSP